MPKSAPHSHFFGRQLPETPEQPLTGKLFVIEGADGSGRSTQIRLLTRWLESKGYAVKQMGIKRSNLAAEQLTLAQQSNVLTHTTMTLFYATDFFDQLVNQILPALSASSIVIADRYVYTLMARALVRGTDEAWLRNLFSAALTPDGVFYFRTSPEQLIVRNLNKNRSLDYWESGMDMGLQPDMFDSFIAYQQLIINMFDKMTEEHGFEVVDADRHVFAVQKELRTKIKAIIKGGEAG